MTTAAVSTMKDEIDVVEGCIRHMAGEVDFLIVVDNASTDGTRDVLARLEEELPTLTVLDDPEIGYYQSRRMTALADMAALQGARWIIPFDADEIWTAEHRLADVLANATHPIAAADLFDHYATALDEDDPDPFRAMVWRRRQRAPLAKVAFWWEPGAVIHQGNHGVTLPSLANLPAADIPGGVVPAGAGDALLQVRHFPYRSAAQMTRKARNGAAAYAATDLPEDMGGHWRSYGRLLDRFGPDALTPVFEEYFWFRSPVDAPIGMVRDPAPYRRWETA